MTIRSALLGLLVTLAAVPAAAQVPLGTPVGLETTGYGTVMNRDPFVPLVQPQRPTAARPSATRPRAGLAGLALADVTVKGIVRNGDAMLAILEGPDRQSFVTHIDDELFDAKVRRIEGEAVVFVLGQSNGAGGQEIRKTLQSAAEVY